MVIEIEKIAAGQFPSLSLAYRCFAKLEITEKEQALSQEQSFFFIYQKQKANLKNRLYFTFLRHYETLFGMHEMFEWTHSTVPTLDLLQVEEVKASFLVGWALGNGVKN